MNSIRLQLVTRAGVFLGILFGIGLVPLFNACRYHQSDIEIDLTNANWPVISNPIDFKDALIQSPAWYATQLPDRSGVVLQPRTVHVSKAKGRDHLAQYIAPLEQRFILLNSKYRHSLGLDRDVRLIYYRQPYRGSDLCTMPARHCLLAIDSYWPVLEEEFALGYSKIKLPLDQQNQLVLEIKEASRSRTRAASIKKLHSLLTVLHRLGVAYESHEQSELNAKYLNYFRYLFGSLRAEARVFRRPSGGISARGHSRGTDHYYGYFKSNRDWCPAQVSIRVFNPEYCNQDLGCVSKAQWSIKSELLHDQNCQDERYHFFYIPNIHLEYNRNKRRDYYRAKYGTNFIKSKEGLPVDIELFDSETVEVIHRQKDLIRGI